MTNPIDRPNAPNEDNPNQKNLETQVNTYNKDYQSLQDNKAYINSVLNELNGIADPDVAFITALYLLMPALVQQTSDEQKLYADQGEIGAALDSFGTSSEGEFEKGSTWDSTDTTTGMQTDDAKQFQDDLADLTWDLNCTNANTPTGKGNILWMVDTNTKTQLSDATASIMSQYGEGCDDLEQWDKESPEIIATETNGMWGSQGKSSTNPTPPPDQISNILGQYQTETNTCNAQEQTATSFLQTWQSYENSYIASEQSVEQNETQQENTFINGTKPL